MTYLRALQEEVGALREEVKSWRGSYIDLWNISMKLWDGDIDLFEFKNWLDIRSGGDLYPMTVNDFLMEGEEEHCPDCDYSRYRGWEKCKLCGLTLRLPRPVHTSFKELIE